MVAGSASGCCDGQILRRCGCLGGGGVKCNGGGWEECCALQPKLSLEKCHVDTLMSQVLCGLSMSLIQDH